MGRSEKIRENERKCELCVFGGELKPLFIDVGN